MQGFEISGAMLTLMQCFMIPQCWRRIRYFSPWMLAQNHPNNIYGCLDINIECYGSIQEVRVSAAQFGP